MIKSFIYENFKSFEKAELNLEAVTSLVGTNASGKSNAIEGISILAELAMGVEISVVLDGTRNHDSHVRGGAKRVADSEHLHFVWDVLWTWMMSMICCMI